MNAGSDPRLELIRSGFEAFNRDDREALLAIMAPDVRCRVLEPLMNSGAWEGHEGYLAMLDSWAEAWEDLRLAVTAVELPSDATAVVTVHQTATGAASGVPVALEVYFVFEVRDGLVVRLEIHPELGSALAAAADGGP